MVRYNDEDKASCGKDLLPGVNKVYRPPMPANLAQLRHRITAGVQEVTPDMLQRVCNIFKGLTYFCHYVDRHREQINLAVTMNSRTGPGLVVHQQTKAKFATVRPRNHFHPSLLTLREAFRQKCNYILLSLVFFGICQRKPLEFKGTKDRKHEDKMNEIRLHNGRAGDPCSSTCEEMFLLRLVPFGINLPNSILCTISYSEIILMELKESTVVFSASRMVSSEEKYNNYGWLDLATSVAPSLVQ
ncbi:hypothetical protein C0J52_08724 [Blattella germanica]|nr:hypothetical protein C0J52_08724 [Blattella germanica]